MPTRATIELNGIIMPDDWLWYDDDAGISLARVQQLVQAAGDFDELTMFINSYGGVMEEGWAIYDYLLSLNKPITGIGLGSVYSMATILLSAGTTRMLSPHTKYMIHLPNGEGWGGNRLDIQAYLDTLIAEEKRIVDIYVAVSGKDESDVAAILADGKDHYYTADEALTYGFTTGIYLTQAEPSAQARGHRPIMARLSEGRKGLNLPERKPITSPQFDMSKQTVRAKAAWDAVQAALNGTPLKALAVDTADGKKLDIETTGDTYVIGDPVKYDDGTDVPDGDIVLSDGNTISVASGVITAITEPSDNSVKTEETPAPKAEGGDTVTITKAEHDRLLALDTTVTALKKKDQENDVFKRRVTAVLALTESADPVEKRPTETSIERRQPSNEDPVAALAKKRQEERKTKK